VEGNVINYTDPSGNIPRPPYPPDTPLIHPTYAKEIQQKLYLLGDPTKAPGWDKFIEKYRTDWANSGKTTWWQHILCQEEPEYDMKEIVMAIAMSKEFGGIDFEPAKTVWAESVGRRYWENCSDWNCFVTSNWHASNSFLNFLSYDETIRIMTMTDYSLVFMTESRKSSVLEVAQKITHERLGFGGKQDNRPYDYFCTNCSGIQSPTWLTRWLSQIVKNSPKSIGMKSYSGDGEMQVAFAAGGSGIFTVILTPRQKMDLCGQSNCFDPELKKPEWIK